MINRQRQINKHSDNHIQWCHWVISRLYSVVLTGFHFAEVRWLLFLFVLVSFWLFGLAQTAAEENSEGIDQSLTSQSEKLVQFTDTAPHSKIEYTSNNNYT